MKTTIAEKFLTLKMNYCRLCRRSCCALEAGVTLCAYRVEILNLKASRVARLGDEADTADFDTIIKAADDKLDAVCERRN